MATYDFGLLTILVVEDNGYMRLMLRMLLSALGVGNVIEKGHGGEAIEFLREVKENPTKAGVSSVDMVMSNWQMNPIDGAMLLKWVRRSKESPDRFIPFVMVSGYGDAEKVAEARDLGATEFVAKPYSVGQLLTRLMLVVGSPRQFVLLDTFLAPIAGGAARRLRAKTAESSRKVKSRSSMTTPDETEAAAPRAETKVRYFRIRNRLKAKTAGAGPQDGPPRLAGGALEKAMKEMKQAEEDYPDWVLQTLTDLMADHKAMVDDPDKGKRHKLFKKISNVAHELKGQGGTFGYPLITIFGKSLNDFTLGEVSICDNQLEIVKSHIDVMRAVINDRIAGDGGEIGNALVASLQQAIKKHS